MTERKSSDVEMKEDKGKRESRRRDRKLKSRKDHQESESSRISSRNSSERNKKRERNNDDDRFKLPQPVKESERERSLRKTVEKLKEKEKKVALENQAKDRKIEELLKQQRQRTESRDKATQSSDEPPQNENVQEAARRKYIEENGGEDMIIQLEENYPDNGGRHYMHVGIHPDLKPWHPHWTTLKLH